MSSGEMRTKTRNSDAKNGTGKQYRAYKRK
jgi:hypothetical protein